MMDTAELCREYPTLIPFLWTCCQAGCDTTPPHDWSVFALEHDADADDGFTQGDVVTGGISQQRAENLVRQHNARVIAYHVSIASSHHYDPAAPVHHYFELSYAEYLALPRSVLQSMSPEWQGRFVECLDELDELLRDNAREGSVYRVQLYEVDPEQEGDGYWVRPLEDPLQDYDRGRRRIVPLPKLGER